MYNVYIMYNVRRANTGEEGLRETKNNAIGLATEDRGRQYQLRRTKDVRPGQVYRLDGVNKDGNLPMAEHYRERERLDLLQSEVRH